MADEGMPWASGVDRGSMLVRYLGAGALTMADNCGQWPGKSSRKGLTRLALARQHDPPEDHPLRQQEHRQGRKCR